MILVLTDVETYKEKAILMKSAHLTYDINFLLLTIVIVLKII
jgi:hypothetical protein